MESSLLEEVNDRRYINKLYRVSIFKVKSAHIITATFLHINIDGELQKSSDLKPIKWESDKAIL